MALPAPPLSHSPTSLSSWLSSTWSRSSSNSICCMAMARGRAVRVAVTVALRNGWRLDGTGAERALLLRPQLLDGVFGPAGGCAVRVGELRKQSDRRSRAGVAGAFAGFVLGITARNVGGDARVQAAVTAFQQIDI